MSPSLHLGRRRGLPPGAPMILLVRFLKDSGLCGRFVGYAPLSNRDVYKRQIQTIVAEVLGQPRNRVVVQSPRMGGGFGGKETQGNAFAAMVALASVKTGKPVRIQLDRDLDMMITGKRHPFHSKFTVGYDRRGMILAAAVDLYSDGGWSLDLSQPVLDRALFHIDNGYYIPALRVTGLIAKTNVASNTAFRGFGGPQGCLLYTSRCV